MRSFVLLAAAATLAIAATAQAGSPATTPAKPVIKEVIVKQVVRAEDGKEIEGATPEAVAVMAQCDAHKFETSAVVGEGASKRVTKLKLCAKAGESDAQWVVTLRQALDRLQGMDQIAPASRAQIADQLKAEIAKLEGGAAKPAN